MPHPDQPAAQGSGPELERRYYIEVERPHHTPAQLMAAVQADVPKFSPGLLADFERTRGRGGQPARGRRVSHQNSGPLERQRARDSR